MEDRTPKRIARPRKRGTPCPEGSIYVGMPTLWGNPFTSKRFGHARSIILHKQWLEGRIGALTFERMGFCPKEIEALDRKREGVLRNLHRLYGRDLACWCPTTSAWCHADTLLAMVPEYSEFERLAA